MRNIPVDTAILSYLKIPDEQGVLKGFSRIGETFKPRLNCCSRIRISLRQPQKQSRRSADQMDFTEDLSARVLLRNILSTEQPRTPITRR